MTAPVPRRPPDAELLAEVHTAAHDAARWLVAAARWECGYELPDLGPDWVTAPRIQRAATLVILGQAFLLKSGLDAEMAAELDAAALKQAAEEMAAAHDWTRRVPLAELERRRSKSGRLTHRIDPAAVASWVASGRSDGGEVPAA